MDVHDRPGGEKLSDVMGRVERAKDPKYGGYTYLCFK